MTATESTKDMVYFSLGWISVSPLYQVTLISGDPPILHSYLVESCCFTSLEESNFLINLGGSGKPKRGDDALNCTDSLNKQGNMEQKL